MTRAGGAYVPVPFLFVLATDTRWGVLAIEPSSGRSRKVSQSWQGRVVEDARIYAGVFCRFARYGGFPTCIGMGVVRLCVVAAYRRSDVSSSPGQDPVSSIDTVLRGSETKADC